MGARPRFALRSYAYLASHALVAAPASWLFAPDASGRRRVLAFHAVRVALGAASARAEARLVSETSRLSPLAGGAALLLLLWSAGMFVASTSFLPSQFAMVCLTHAAARVLAGEHRAACAACVLAVVLGWPFAGVAAIPYGLASLRAVGFAPTLFAVSISLLLSSLASFAIDRHFYGRDTWSVANIVRYNVLADTGGNSQLYGVESPTFYLRNLANAFNVALLASLAAPFAATSASAFRETPPARRAAYAKLLLAYSPFPLALAFFSALAHKEERFMYVAYPHLGLGAAIACAALVDVAGAAARAGVAPAAPRSSPPRSRFCSSSRTRGSPRRGSRRSWTGTARRSAPSGAFPNHPNPNRRSEDKVRAPTNRPGDRASCASRRSGTGSRARSTSPGRTTRSRF